MHFFPLAVSALIFASLLAGQSTPFLRPLTVTSNESDKAQLKLAREQGEAVQQAVDWELAHASGPTGHVKAGEFDITYTLTAPEGWYELAAGQLAWLEPTEATAHLKVCVRDGADGRTVPFLRVRAKWLGGGGAELKPLPWGWYPLLDGYGDNVRLPAGSYRLRVEIEPLDVQRHDPYNGDRFAKPVIAEFPPVTVPAQPLTGMPLSSAEEGQLPLAKLQGDALGRTTRAMWAQANSGAEKPVDDYTVSYAVEYSEASWQFHGAKFRYSADVEQSGEQNSHIEVAPMDPRTGRFLPVSNVQATILTSAGEPAGSSLVPFMWHPWLYHYGKNMRVPRASKDYRLRITFDPPSYRRYGRDTGKHFATAVDTTFENVRILTGQK